MGLIFYGLTQTWRRLRLSISDEAILGEHPDKEDFLLPDLKVDELPVWDEHAQFAQITIPTQDNS